MPVTGYTKVDDNDFEKLIPLSQVAAGVTPAKRYVDDGDVAALINALQVAAGYPANQRTNLLDRKDWEKKLIEVQGKLNMRTITSVTIATPSVVNLTAHGWQPNQGFKFFTTGALPTGITAGTTYYVSATGFGANAFQYSATRGGASINTSGSQSGTQSVYAA